ncbi:MAG: YdiU family protein [Rhodobacteraceae bacterium]|nr:YdiU family protein [Paracoccaceae bacterium]
MPPGQQPISFDNSYARLPERFFARQPPAAAPRPRLVRLNAALAQELGIDPGAMEADAWAELFAGNALPEGAEPLAMAYAGHQFGNLVPQLGDGRALLLGEVVDIHGHRRDIQLKGSGRTPFSRMGDGRAALGPVLREYLVSEAMHALGIPTTRALAAVTTGEPVFREERLPGAVLARVAGSHIRVGTFQFFAIRRDEEALSLLVAHTITRHDPDLAGTPDAALALLRRVMERQARLVAAWMGVGFIHGVMNTDNFALSGETIDYGPCAFMDAYHPGRVFSSIDHQGRYAYGNQPRIANWNLARLAETLLPLIDTDPDRALERANEAIAAFPSLYEQAHMAVMRAKLGLMTEEPGDAALAEALLEAMARNEADFTLTFAGLSGAISPDGAEAARARFVNPREFDTWAEGWRARLAREGGDEAARRATMARANPQVIPRNHKVEEALATAVSQEDFGPFERLLSVLERPFDSPEDPSFTQPPAASERVFRTFCGT